MGLINDIAQVDQDLALVYAEAKANWKRDKPLGPWPELNETYRPNAVSEAYYAQSRQPLAVVNKLREAAGLYLIDAAENKVPVTAVKAGSSAHNHHFALDVRIRLLVPVSKAGQTVVVTGPDNTQYTLGGIDWGGSNGNKYYVQFGGYMIAAARKLAAEGKIIRKIRWGHDWNGDGVYGNDGKFIDDPHFEIKGWGALVAAGIKARLA